MLKVQEDHKDPRVLKVLRENLELQFQLEDQLELKELYLLVMLVLLEMLGLFHQKEDFMFSIFSFRLFDSENYSVGY